MKILCLGCAGAISRESVLDLVQTSSFEKITIADCNETAGKEVAAWLNDSRVAFEVVDVYDKEAAVRLIREYDIVLDGTPISVNLQSTLCIAEAEVHGINLNGMGCEWVYDDSFKASNKTLIPGFGMTPGTTNMMAQYAANQLDTVDTVCVSHGAFRPIAFSKAIAETTRYEYDPKLDSRIVFEKGKFVQVPPFARPKMIELPAPFGTHEQYIIPHSETVTLAKSLAHKGIQKIEVRGTWPPKNMALIKSAL